MDHEEATLTAEELGSRLGKRIAAYRKHNRMTQAMLAELAGVDSETISRFERGTALPSLVRLFEIAQALKVGVGDLLVEASSLPLDAERILAGVLEEIKPDDRQLLGQIAELMRNRR